MYPQTCRFVCFLRKAEETRKPAVSACYTARIDVPAHALIGADVEATSLEAIRLEDVAMAMVTEKLLPQNVEAEAGVLGSLLIDPDAMAQ
ncbi:MAG TPA: hypothetical protein VF725_06210, partial [Ktedonobacterales bacterium]